MLVTEGPPTGSVMLKNSPPSGNTLFFVFYCYENNSQLYFYCNWLESWVQVSYEGVSYKECRQYNIKMVNFWMNWIKTVCHWNSSPVSQTELKEPTVPLLFDIISSWNLKYSMKKLQFHPTYIVRLQTAILRSIHADPNLRNNFSVIQFLCLSKSICNYKIAGINP